MVFGDVDEEIFIRAKLVPAKLALSFSSLTLRRELHILQIHAASLAGSTGFRTSHLLNTGCHSLNARTHNNHWLVFTIIRECGGRIVIIVLVVVLRVRFQLVNRSALKRLQCLRLLPLQHWSTDDQWRPAICTLPSCRRPPCSHYLHTTQELLGFVPPSLPVVAAFDWQGVVVWEFPGRLIGSRKGGHRYGVRQGGGGVFTVQRGDLRDLLFAQVSQHALTAHSAAQAVPLFCWAALIGAINQEVLQTRPSSAAPLEGPAFTDSQWVIFIRVVALWLNEERPSVRLTGANNICVYKHLLCSIQCFAIILFVLIDVASPRSVSVPRECGFLFSHL